MSTDDTASLIYLVALGSFIGFWFFVANRSSLSKTMQQAAMWGLIFLGVIAAYGLWGDIRQTVLPQQSVFAEQGRVELPRAQNGHYYALLDINGTPTRFVVDTGATAMVLTMADAERAGLAPEDFAFFSEAMTANGPVRTAPVTLDSVTLGPFTDTGVRAFVNEGQMDQSLLGMSYLQRFDRLEITGGKMVLER